jgi:hypothetical protein
LKNLLIVFTTLAILLITQFSFAYSKAPIFSFSSEKLVNFKVLDIWIEYLCIDGLWYEITHYNDGSVGVQLISKPPND